MKDGGGGRRRVRSKNRKASHRATEGRREEGRYKALHHDHLRLHISPHKNPTTITLSPFSSNFFLVISLPPFSTPQKSHKNYFSSIPSHKNHPTIPFQWFFLHSTAQKSHNSIHKITKFHRTEQKTKQKQFHSTLQKITQQFNSQNHKISFHHTKHHTAMTCSQFPSTIFFNVSLPEIIIINTIAGSRRPGEMDGRRGTIGV